MRMSPRSQETPPEQPIFIDEALDRGSLAETSVTPAPPLDPTESFSIPSAAEQQVAQDEAIAVHRAGVQGALSHGEPTKDNTGNQEPGAGWLPTHPFDGKNDRGVIPIPPEPTTVTPPLNWTHKARQDAPTVAASPSVAPVAPGNKGLVQRAKDTAASVLKTAAGAIDKLKPNKVEHAAPIAPLVPEVSPPSPAIAPGGSSPMLQRKMHRVQGENPQNLEAQKVKSTPERDPTDQLREYQRLYAEQEAAKAKAAAPGSQTVPPKTTGPNNEPIKVAPVPSTAPQPAEAAAKLASVVTPEPVKQPPVRKHGVRNALDSLHGPNTAPSDPGDATVAPSAAKGETTRRSTLKDVANLAANVAILAEVNAPILERQKEMERLQEEAAKKEAARREARPQVIKDLEQWLAIAENSKQAGEFVMVTLASYAKQIHKQISGQTIPYATESERFKMVSGVPSSRWLRDGGDVGLVLSYSSGRATPSETSQSHEDGPYANAIGVDPETGDLYRCYHGGARILGLSSKDFDQAYSATGSKGNSISSYLRFAEERVQELSELTRSTN